MIKRLKEYLDQNNIKYQIITHSTAYTAQEIAASAHVSGSEMAKVVLVKSGVELVMTVLPASHIVDLRRVKEITGATYVELASEDQYRNLFDESEPGAEPPFGNLYGLKVYVSTELSENPHIAFNGGTHKELVKLSYSDFQMLVKPQVFAFSIKEHVSKKDRHSGV